MIYRYAVLVVLAAVLAGCVALQEPAPEVEAPAPVAAPAPDVADTPRAGVAVGTVKSELEQLLEYFQRVKSLPGAELGREQESARLAFNRTRSDFDRVRLAMVLALPQAPANGDMRALDLLDPLVKNRSAPLHSLALLMGAFLQEQRRLEAGAQGLQQKLDALKSMERSLLEREQAAQKKR